MLTLSMPLLSTDLVSRLRGKMILAPLTRGGNLPYRRLCADFGMDSSFSEMVYARQLLKNEGIELARMRRAPGETTFGVQIATNEIDEGVAAAKMAAASGADWVDLNCGCPIYEATRRGLGAALLRKPHKLEQLVAGIAAGSSLPLSVKVRTGEFRNALNVRDVASRLRDAGAAMVTIHGRTMEDRYKRPADWDVIAQVVADGAGSGVGVVGNGDILTHYDARRRLDESGVDAVMVGRGALIKPWVFQEFERGEPWEPSAAERVEIMRRLVVYMKEHFGDDARGRKKAWAFLPWHLDWFARYLPLPEAEWGAFSREEPLMQMRRPPLPADLPALDRLLASRAPGAHDAMSGLLWEAASDAAAVDALRNFAEGGGLAEVEAAAAAEAEAEEEELANVGQAYSGGLKKQRRRRAAPVIRTPQEIAALRAQRALKRKLTGAAPHVEGTRR